MMGREHLDLPATVESPRRARQFVADHLHGWGYDNIAPDAALLTNELVANAVQHGTEPYAVEVVDLRDGVFVAVEDTGLELPVLRHRGPFSVSGRGLVFVDAIASAWGTRPIPDGGKFVWFRLATA
jgi:anti-sigma regulatory factor (Ser/Thr protein kinase)